MSPLSPKARKLADKFCAALIAASKQTHDGKPLVHFGRGSVWLTPESQEALRLLYEELTR